MSVDDTFSLDSTREIHTKLQRTRPPCRDARAACHAARLNFRFVSKQPPLCPVWQCHLGRFGAWGRLCVSKIAFEKIWTLTFWYHWKSTTNGRSAEKKASSFLLIFYDRDVCLHSILGAYPLLELLVLCSLVMCSHLVCRENASLH